MSLLKPVLGASTEVEGSHLRIHRTPCMRCPSARGLGDPESDQIRDEWPRAAQLETLFVCAWRPSALCRGWCDELKVTAEMLPAIDWDRLKNGR